MLSKKYLPCLLVAPLLLGCSQSSEAPPVSKQGQGSWTIQFVDAQTQQEIPQGKVIVSETKQTFEISQRSPVISLPSLPKGPSEGRFQMGYTLLSYAKGYLPRLDHNVPIVENDTMTVTLELQRPSGNAAYTEFFHPSSANAATDFISHYLGNAPYAETK